MVPRIFPTNLVESRKTGYKPVDFTANHLTTPYITMPSDPSIQSQRHCLARLMKHQNHSPLEEAQPSLPGTFSNHGEGVIACIPTWSVPSSVTHSSHVPCVTAATH